MELKTYVVWAVYVHFGASDSPNRGKVNVRVGEFHYNRRKQAQTKAQKLNGYITREKVQRTTPVPNVAKMV